MSVKILTKKIKETAIRLNLQKSRLTELPPNISLLTGLQILCLDDNKLTFLPSMIGELVQLRTLSLQRNQLLSLPGEIGKLVNLLNLDLLNNNLDVLPTEISGLVKLQDLYLRKNKLTSLPNEIGKLTKLETLDLMDNQLTTLPKEIGNLYNLTKLSTLGNTIDFPPEIGKLKLTKLSGSKSHYQDNLMFHLWLWWKFRRYISCAMIQIWFRKIRFRQQCSDVSYYDVATLISNYQCYTPFLFTFKELEYFSHYLQYYIPKECSNSPTKQRDDRSGRSFEQSKQQIKQTEQQEKKEDQRKTEQLKKTNKEVRQITKHRRNAIRDKSFQQ